MTSSVVKSMWPSSNNSHNNKTCNFGFMFLCLIFWRDKECSTLFLKRELKENDLKIDYHFETRSYWYHFLLFKLFRFEIQNQGNCLISIFYLKAEKRSIDWSDYQEVQILVMNRKYLAVYTLFPMGLLSGGIICESVLLIFVVKTSYI